MTDQDTTPVEPVETPVGATQDPEIRDLRGLFLYSGMIESLRDASHELIGHVVAPATLASMSTQYTELREKLQETLREDLAEETLRWAVDLPDENLDIAAVFQAASALARWADLIHKSETFLIEQKVVSANGRIAEMAAAKASADADASAQAMMARLNPQGAGTPGPTGGAIDPSSRPGLYL